MYVKNIKGAQQSFGEEIKKIKSKSEYLQYQEKEICIFFHN